MDEKRFAKWLVLLIVGSFAFSSLVNPVSAGDHSDTETAAPTRTQVPVNNLTLIPSAVAQQADSGTPVMLDIAGNNVEVQLVPTDLGREYYDQGVQTFVGFGHGIGSFRATICGTWFHAYLILNQTEFVIEPAYNAAAPGTYSVYSGGQIEASQPESYPIIQTGVSLSTGNESDFAVAATEGDGSETSASVSTGAEWKRNETCPPGGDPEYRLARIILACDSDYRDRYPTDWSARMISGLNEICGRYESQVGVTFRLATSPYAIPSGSCTSTDPDTLLSQFRTYMRSNGDVAGILRDVSHLYTGKDLSGDITGIAFYAGIGGEEWGWVDQAYSLSEQWRSSFENMWAMGHEIGHNFNGDHNYWSWIGGCRSWMYPTYSSPMTGQFSSNNAARIRSWAEQSLDRKVFTNPGPSSVSTDGLQASGFTAQGPFVFLVNNQITVTYSIKNTASVSITLNLLFVGARDASGNNRDFGLKSNVYIAPYSTYSYSTTLTPLSGGTWTMWPAYRTSGGSYGPYQWITITPTFYFEKASWIGMDMTGSSDNVDLYYRFSVLTTVESPVSGSTVTVFVSMFNGKSGTSTTDFQYFFVGCRNGAGASRDFGITGARTLTQIGESPATGGGCLVFASRTLDSSGTWTFWPAYKISGHYGPYMWHSLTLVVG